MPRVFPQGHEAYKPNRFSAADGRKLADHGDSTDLSEAGKKRTFIKDDPAKLEKIDQEPIKYPPDRIMYRELALKFHPDKYKGADGEEMFKNIQVAKGEADKSDNSKLKELYKIRILEAEKTPMT